MSNAEDILSVALGEQELAQGDLPWYEALEVPAPRPNYTNALATGLFERAILRDITEAAPQMAREIEQASETMPTFPDLALDLFNALYQHQPELRDVEEMAPSHGINHQIVTELQNLQEVEQLRAHTTLDPHYAAFGAQGLVEGALAAYNRIGEEQKAQARQAAQQALEQERAAEALRQQLEQVQQQARQMPDPQAQADLHAQAERALEQHRQATQGADAAKGQMSQALGQGGGALRDALRTAIDKAAQPVAEAAAADQLMQSLGNQGGSGYSPFGSTARGPQALEDKLKAMKRIEKSRVLKMILKIAGRFHTLMEEAQLKRKTDHAPDEVVDVILGGDLSKVLGSELANLGHPALRRDFLVRLDERRLMQSKTEGVRPGKHGNIIFADDNSGSMEATIGRVDGTTITREGFAKCIQLECWNIAKRQDRKMVVLHYHDQRKAKDVKEYRLTPNETSAEEVIESLEYSESGGTAYEGWMRRATEVMDEDQYQEGAIIHVSDALCAVPAEVIAAFNAARQAKRVKVYSVLVGPAYGVNVLGEFSDVVLHVNSIAEADQAAATAFSI